MGRQVRRGGDEPCPAVRMKESPVREELLASVVRGFDGSTGRDGRAAPGGCVARGFDGWAARDSGGCVARQGPAYRQQCGVRMRVECGERADVEGAAAVIACGGKLGVLDEYIAGG